MSRPFPLRLPGDSPVLRELMNSAEKTKVDNAGMTLHGHNGGVWEWTSTPLAPLQGYAPSKLYPGYSSDFFDSKHFVVVSPGCSRDHGDEADSETSSAGRTLPSRTSPSASRSETGIRVTTDSLSLGAGWRMTLEP